MFHTILTHSRTLAVPHKAQWDSPTVKEWWFFFNLQKLVCSKSWPWNPFRLSPAVFRAFAQLPKHFSSLLDEPSRQQRCSEYQGSWQFTFLFWFLLSTTCRPDVWDCRSTGRFLLLFKNKGLLQVYLKKIILNINIRPGLPEKPRLVKIQYNLKSLRRWHNNNIVCINKVEYHFALMPLILNITDCPLKSKVCKHPLNLYGTTSTIDHPGCLCLLSFCTFIHFNISCEKGEVNRFRCLVTAGSTCEKPLTGLGGQKTLWQYGRVKDKEDYKYIQTLQLPQP